MEYMTDSHIRKEYTYGVIFMWLIIILILLVLYH